MRRFGEFLAARKLVDSASLAEALVTQEETIVPLGRLAIAGSHLTEEQVRSIQENQRSVDRKLGEIAVDHDWLTSEQLNELLSQQSHRRVRLGELLVQNGTLDRPTMEAALADFERIQAEQDRQLEDILGGLESSEVIRSLLDFTAKHLLRTTREPVKISSVSFERALSLQANEQPQYFFSQAASGDRPLVYGLLMQRPAILSMASRMLDQDRSEIDDLVLDSVCEFVNMVVGNCFARLAQGGIRLHPDPPSYCTADEAARALSGCTRVELVSRSTGFSVVLSFSSAC